MVLDEHASPVECVGDQRRSKNTSSTQSLIEVTHHPSVCCGTINRYRQYLYCTVPGDYKNNFVALRLGYLLLCRSKTRCGLMVGYAMMLIDDHELAGGFGEMQGLAVLCASLL